MECNNRAATRNGRATTLRVTPVLALLGVVAGCSDGTAMPVGAAGPAVTPGGGGPGAGGAAGAGAAGSGPAARPGTAGGAGGMGGVTGASGAGGLSGMSGASGAAAGAGGLSGMSGASGAGAGGTSGQAGASGAVGGPGGAGGLSGMSGAPGMAGAGGLPGAGAGSMAAAGGAGSMAGAGGAAGAAGAPERRRKVVGYLSTRGGFANYATRVDFARLTHLNLAFANPKDGKPLTFGATADAELNTLVSAAHAHGVKVLVSIGGGGGGSHLSCAQLVPSRVDAFVNTLMTFIDRYQLDGLDVDIEGSAVNQNYDPFVAKVRAKLKLKGKLLTCALGSWHARNLPDGTFARFDFINVMAYDACGTWTRPCPHSDMAHATGQLDYFKRHGVAADRLVLGVPFYGYCWGTGCPGGKNNSHQYRHILRMYPEARTKDWITGPNLELSHNGEPTIRKKAELAKQYAGAMIWELFYDAEGNDSLLRVLTDTLQMP